MTDQIEQLKHEIEELERQIAAHPFGGLFDRKRADQLYHRLKKKRKELEHALAGPAPSAPSPAPQPVLRAEPIRPVPAVGGGGIRTERIVESKPAARVAERKAPVKPKPQAKPGTKKPAAPTKTKAKSKPAGSGSQGHAGVPKPKSVKPKTKKKSR